MAATVVFSILAVSTLLTSFISGILGMAGGMIFMGVLLALLPLPTAMLLHGIVQLASNGWRAMMLRNDIDRRVLAGSALGTVAALLVFALFTFVANKAVALIVMGVTPFLAMALPDKLHLKVERPGQPFACGLICGALSLTAGISGPILDVFFVRSKMSRHAVVATKAASQSVAHFFKILYFGGVLTVTGAQVSPVMAISMVLLAFAGTTASRGVLERISDTTFRQWTRWTVLALGGAYLVSGVLALA